MITKTDTELVVSGVTVTQRRWAKNGKFLRGDLFIGGWRSGTYKTEGGLKRATARVK